MDGVDASHCTELLVWMLIQQVPNEILRPFGDPFGTLDFVGENHYGPFPPIFVGERRYSRHHFKDQNAQTQKSTVFGNGCCCSFAAGMPRRSLEQVALQFAVDVPEIAEGLLPAFWKLLSHVMDRKLVLNVVTNLTTKLQSGKQE
jgi:hypothetical protein